jgi:hypothetical protein
MHVVPPSNHKHNLISYPHSRIHFIINILIVNTGLSSFNYSFLYILRSLISSINIVILCPTMVIILFFIFELLLYWTVTVLNLYCLELLLYWTVTVLNRYYLELLLFWTIIVFVFESLLSWTVIVLNHYCLEPLLYWIVTVFFFKSLLFWTVTILNCYCFYFWTVTVFKGSILTSPQIFNYIQSSRTLFQARLVSLES